MRALKINSSKPIYIIGLFICALASLFYVYDFILRIIPGTIFTFLTKYYNLDSASLGFLSSAFFLGYILMQLPCGLLYDRFGPRKVLSVAALVASVATYFFLATPYFSVATIARFFMGIGSACAYIGALVLVSRWLPSRRAICN